MKNDIEYEKGHKIAEEIVDLMQSEERNFQSEEFQEWVLEDKSAINVLKKFSNNEALEDAYTEFKTGNHKNDVEHLISSIQTKEKSKRRIQLIKITASSVAALLCVSFLIQTLLTKEKIPADMLSKVEINKTIFRPTLILEDGENVDLTSRNSKLNDTIVKKSGQNKLTYDSTSITNELKYNTLIIPKLFTYTVELSDGTTICLNANSELKYPIQFNQDKREVYLKGEGYFNVKKGEKPFIIHTGDIKVQVYGTQFNINAYNKSSIKTVLIQGSVGVAVKDGDPVMMKPNQMVEVTSNGETIISDVDLTQYITWLDGDITSTNAPLTDLLDKISAWYGIEFNCTIDLKGINVTTSLSNKLSLEKILNGISETTNLKIIKNGENRYMIK